MTTGQRIKNRRIELGLSVDDVAKILGKNRATVYRYESDDIENLPTTVLEPLAKILQSTPAELMGWKVSDKIADFISICNDESLIEFNSCNQKNYDKQKMLMTYFNKLNSIGQSKILDTIEDLSKIYGVDDSLKAAHNDNKIDQEELDKMSQDIDDLKD